MRRILLHPTRWRRASRVLMMLLCTAFTLPSIAETLTVYDGTATNDYVPIYGLYVDDYLKCEFIIPASELVEMKDGTITGLTWYLSRTATASWGNANFQVFIKEVDFTSFSSNAFSGINGATTVYQGSLDGTHSPMNITFSTPYEYGGGNLLVCVYNTVKGTYKSSAFYGMSVNNASIYGYNSSSLNNLTTGSRQNFAPKTMFTYEPSSTNAKPTDLAVSDITANSAKVSWTGNNDVQSYNLRYRKAAYSEIPFFDDFEKGLGNWTIYTDGTAPQTDGWTITANGALDLNAHSGSNVASSWSWSGDAYDADNWLITPQVTFGKNLKFWVSTAGNWPDSYEVLLSTSGNAENNFTVTLQAMATAPTNNQWNEVVIDLSAYEGQTGYIAIHHVSSDCNYLIIDDFGIYGDDVEAGEWIPISPAIIPQDITGLEPGTEYEVQVQAVYADGTSDWTNSVNFTTLSTDAMPTNLAVTDVTDCTATANWDGVQDSYNLRYRKYIDPINQNRFWDFPIVNGYVQTNGWQSVDNDGDGYNWGYYATNSQFTDACLVSESYHNNDDGQTGVALTPDNWYVSPVIKLGGTLRFKAWRTQYEGEVLGVYIYQEGNENFVQVGQDIEPLQEQTVYEFDLSGFEGTGLIIIRHYNCSDAFRVYVDDIEVTVPDPQEDYPWTTINDVTSPYSITGLEPETDYEVQVQGIYDGGTTNWTNSEYFTTLEEVQRLTTLANLIENGVDGLRYTISEPLHAVYAMNNSLWLKDANGLSVELVQNTNNYQNFVLNAQENTHSEQMDYDQSNWIEVQLTDEAIDYAGRMINAEAIKGTFNKNKLTITGVTLTENDIVGGAQSATIDYIPNCYCMANFEGSQKCTVTADHGWFFLMTPKPQEYAQIVWAQYAGNGIMTIPTEGNAHGFVGSFTVDYSLSTSEPVEGNVYNFKGIVRKNAGAKSSNYEVFALDNLSSSVITAVTDVNSKTVAGVKYYNVAGMASDRPFDGVNIVVTRYTDGSTSTVKVVK